MTEKMPDKILRVFHKIIDGMEKRLDKIPDDDMITYKQFSTSLAQILSQAKNASDSHRLDEIEKRIAELMEGV